MISLVILILSAVIHFIFFGHPHAVVFDEVYMGDFISRYWQGSYYFDIHPPLLKLVEALFGYLTGAAHMSANFDAIGNVLPFQIILLRILPMIAGTILPLIIYALLRKLEFSKSAALTASILLCLENSLIVQSRFILFDLIMLVFGFLSILLYLEWNSRPKNPLNLWFLAGSIVAASLALSIKWTGAAYLLLIILMELFKLYQQCKPSKSPQSFHLSIFAFFHRPKLKSLAKKILPFAGLYCLIALLIYISVFAIHLSLLNRSGPGDAFMSAQFQKTLSDNRYATNTAVLPISFTQKFVELNIEMLSANTHLNATHEYSSKWYTWPFMLRPVFYWQSDTSTTSPPDSARSYIYYLGNPFIYWLSGACMLGLIMFAVILLITKQSHTLNIDQRKILFFLIVGYLVNFLPFIFIGRVMFLYHYEAALVFAVMGIAYIIDCLGPRRKSLAIIIVLLLAAAAFIYWSPLTYGTPITQSQLQARMWFPSWR